MLTISDKHVSLPPDPTFFTGREAFLQTLRERLLREQVAIITGSSGVGKTAVALEYVHRFSRQYRLVLWINAATGESFLADTLALAQQFSLPIDTSQGFAGLVQVLQRWLVGQPDTLLVMDNATILQTAPNMPEQRHTGSHVLIIPRTLNTAPAVPCLDLPPLDAEEGALFILRQAGLLSSAATLDQVPDEQRTLALALARELQGLPLALKLAGSYLKETGCSVQNYLFSYRDYPARPCQPDSSKSEKTEVIEVTCGLTLAHLAQEWPGALELLSLCALLSPDAIPVALVQFAHLPQADDIGEAIHVYEAFGLLTVHKATAELDMHALIQATVRQMSSPDKRHQRIEWLLRACQQFVVAQEPESLPVRLHLARHIQHLALLGEQQVFSCNEAAEAFGWAASLLREQGMIGEAELLLKKALAVWEHTLELTHPVVAAVLLDLAMLNVQMQHYAQAENLAQRAITAKSQALGVNHPDVLLSLATLGHVYLQQNKQREAMLCYRQALSIGSRVNLQNHPFFIASMHDLALLAIEQGEFSDAQLYLEKVCAIWEYSPGFTHPSTIQAWHHLARLYVRLEDQSQAQRCYQRVLPAYERVLGKEHPETLRCQEEAASIRPSTKEGQPVSDPASKL